MPQKQLQSFARILQASPRLVFSQKALMNSLFAGIVNLVRDAWKVCIKSRKLQIIIDFVQQIPQGCSIPIPSPNQPREPLWQLLLDCLLQHGTAHHSTCRKQAKKIAARRFIQIAVSLL
jgi:hypothetical protein